ncbi:UGDH-AS1 isoform 2 [Pongo abelii]|uniref:UGDH-AS1 isoform 2 n=1 Tax=Pongo abelii TaxID=9601 RepID=A0A2J8TCW8_PONAB|nr:UGDH-AS1 isoform 2 [Pongo abelii]
MFLRPNPGFGMSVHAVEQRVCNMVSLCHPGWNALARTHLTAASTSQAEMTLQLSFQSSCDMVWLCPHPHLILKPSGRYVFISSMKDGLIQ